VCKSAALGPGQQQGAAGVGALESGQHMRLCALDPTGALEHDLSTGALEHALSTGALAHALSTGALEHALSTGALEHALSTGALEHALSTRALEHALSPVRVGWERDGSLTTINADHLAGVQ
jgi:hypothetical protein